ncbi:MAG TPA: nucleotidyltransferase domain-containing protein [Longimicrobium sp.]|jgi:hypothetical protein
MPSRLELNIAVPRPELGAFCRRNHVRKLSFFGSVLRDDFGPESDVDVLVEFEPGHTIGYFGLSDGTGAFGDAGPHSGPAHAS